MSITHINYDFDFYYCMVGLVSLWNCGVVAITRQGKIFHFVLRFFERKKKVRTPFGEVACKVYDDEMITAMKMEVNKNDREELTRIVEDFMYSYSIHSDRTAKQIVTTLLSRWITEHNEPNAEAHPNEYYYFAQVGVFPDWVKDPIVACVTCMASLHSILIYTAVDLYKDFYFNPLEWVAVAIPSAFVGELLWSLKKQLQLNLK